MGKHNREIQIRILLVVIALVISYAAYGLFQENFERWNTKAIDQLFALRTTLAGRPSTGQEKVVHVDANSYLNRPQQARIIHNLHKMNVAALVMDYVFAGEVGEDDDGPLIDAVAEAKKVYPGMMFESLQEPASAVQAFLPSVEQEYLDQTPWRISTSGATDALYTGVKPKITFPALSSASRGLGFMNILPDRDGMVRRMPLVVRYRSAFYPSLAFRAVCDYLGVSTENIVVNPGRSIVLKNAKLPDSDESQNLEIPIDMYGNFLLNYSESAGATRHFSSSEIIQATEGTPQFDQFKKELAGKIIVFSEAVGEGYKIRPIKAGIRLSSGEIHAAVIQNIAGASFLQKLSGLTMIGIEIVLLLIILFLSTRFSSISLTLTGMLTAVIFCLLGMYGFIYFNVIIQFFRPLVLIILSLSVLLIYTGIEKALLHARTERARKIAERELEIGREIQSGFFPARFPVPDDWELVTHFKAARHVAGDFYDVFTLGKDRKLGMVIADVCDKGVGAALFMALFRSLTRVLSGQADSDNHLITKQSARDPGNTLQDAIVSVNDYISITHEDAGMFATMFYAILDPDSGDLHYINGGHEPPVIINGGKIRTWLKPTGPAVGLYPHLEFEVRKVNIESGDTLVVYTDGVIDAQNKSDEAFGKHRLVDLFKNSYPTAQILIDTILDQINVHISDQSQFDDITILALSRRT
jgi:serine phosphatase RsbU (regulator of sigma subunit)